VAQVSALTSIKSKQICFDSPKSLCPKPAEPEPNWLLQSGQTDPSVMQANLDDPPIHPPNFVPADAGSKDKNPMGSVLLSTPIIAPTNLDRHQIFRNFCHNKARPRFERQRSGRY
jgi:hypothetical protein